MIFEELLNHNLLDVVHPPEGHVLRCALGYTLLDVVHLPEGYALRYALGYTLLDEVHQPKGYALRYILYIQLNYIKILLLNRYLSIDNTVIFVYTVYILKYTV